MKTISLIATVSFALNALAAVAPVGTNGGIVTLAEMKAWVDKQDPLLITIEGDPFKSLNARGTDAAETITVTFCSTISGSVCTGPCTVTSGSGVCINAPNTNCLFATGQVSFCDRGGCGGSCNVFNSCGSRLQNNFCATPGTQSIGIPAGS